MITDPGSGLLLPRQFVDEKQALKKLIDECVDKAVEACSHIKETYFLTLNMKFAPTGEFTISAPSVSFKLPPFCGNQFVFWVNPNQGICELLWMVPPTKKGEKLRVEFNTEGVAYLQAKQAMPKRAG